MTQKHTYRRIGRNNQINGKKFEQYYASILKDLGKFNVKTNVILKKKNFRSEFDVVYGFIRKHYIECKYKKKKSKVTAKEVSVFAKKLDIYNINNSRAFIVTNRYLSSKASYICKKSHIKAIERDKLKKLDYKRLNLVNSLKCIFSKKNLNLEDKIMSLSL